MNRFKFVFQSLILVAVVTAFSFVANAQATRTWVSGVGDDVNPCSRTAPCKTFAGAISKTATGGEINCIDPGGFGAVTVTKSITIDCSGTFGSILSSLANGITVNAAAGVVRFRNLAINGAGSGFNGIRVVAASKVSIENVTMDGFTTHGISIETTSGATKVVVDNVKIRNAAGNGINSFITGGTANITVSNSNISHCATGVNFSSNTKGAIQSSTLAANTTGLGAASAEMGVKDCLITNNGTGVNAFAGGIFRISSNIITANTTGVTASGGGSVLSYSNNVINGNTTDGGPTGLVSLN